MHIYLLKVRYMISYTLPAVPNATALSLTPTSCPTPLPKAAPRPPPPPKVTWRPLWTPHPLIQTLLQCSSETLQAIMELGQLPQHLILRVKSLR